MLAEQSWPDVACGLVCNKCAKCSMEASFPCKNCSQGRGMSRRHSKHSGDKSAELQAWLAPRFAVNMTQRWATRHPKKLERPPRSRNCVVTFMPAHKSIYIKQQKAGGTSVLFTMGHWCGRRGDNVTQALDPVRTPGVLGASSSSWQLTVDGLLPPSKFIEMSLPHNPAACTHGRRAQNLWKQFGCRNRGRACCALRQCHRKAPAGLATSPGRSCGEITPSPRLSGIHFRELPLPTITCLRSAKSMCGPHTLTDTCVTSMKLCLLVHLALIACIAPVPPGMGLRPMPEGALGEPGS